MATTVSRFVGGDYGQWKVTSIHTVTGDSPGWVSYVRVDSGEMPESDKGEWALKGGTSNLRYTERAEKEALTALQAGLGRPEATCAALIPIRKTEAWWALTQDERRSILVGRSHHILMGLAYLPVIARKLYHCRDLGEPFDFLTWFEHAPGDADAFNELVASLCKTEEWKYVDWEVDIRLVKA